jgi:hypothetical protein
MQFHYVVGYDTELKKWFIESDTTAYFVDGNVWDEKQAEVEFVGWKVPEEGSPEEAIDYDLLNTLGYIVDTFPVPQGV